MLIFVFKYLIESIYLKELILYFDFRIKAGVRYYLSASFVYLRGSYSHSIVAGGLLEMS